MNIGQRATFTNGAKGTIERVMNGGAMYVFAADSGARFTVRADEVAPEGETPKAKHVETSVACRTVVAFERPYAEPRHPPQRVARPADPAQAPEVA